MVDEAKQPGWSRSISTSRFRCHDRANAAAKRRQRRPARRSRRIRRWYQGTISTTPAECTRCSHCDESTAFVRPAVPSRSRGDLVARLGIGPGARCAGDWSGRAGARLTALDGQTFDLAKLRGKVVLVNYWATWRAPCRKEMPRLDAFDRRYHGHGLEMIGISIDLQARLRKGSTKPPRRSPVSDRGVKGHHRRRLRDAARRADHLGHRCRRQGPRPIDRGARRIAEWDRCSASAALNEGRAQVSP